MMSVCICTYNRAASLRRTLQSLAAQTEVEWNNFEVVIIDNNCTDDTEAVVATFYGRLPLRIVRERQQGLAHARNRALADATGDVVLFTDDDVRLDPSWLAAYARAVAAFPTSDFFGGRILPDWGVRKPYWVGDKPIDLLDGVLVWYDHGLETRLVLADETLPCGASFAISRALAERTGLFRPDLGRNGTDLGRGEETEFLMRARAAGATGVYVGEALCWHAVDPRRLTLTSLFRYGLASGRAHNAMSRAPHHGSLQRAVGFLLRGAYQLVKGRGDRFRQSIINSGFQIGLRYSCQFPTNKNLT